MKPLRLLLLTSILSTCAFANAHFQGVCAQSGNVTTSGLNSTNTSYLTYPSATVTVSVVGGGLATIFSDNSGTPLANPFTANSDGTFSFYAANGRYSTVCSGTSIPTISFLDNLLFDPTGNAVTCTNQFIDAVSATGVYTCATITGPATDSTIAKTGGDLSTANPATVTQAHITGGTQNALAKFNATGNPVPSSCSDDGTTVNCTNPLTDKNIGLIRYASNFSGADWAAKLCAADVDLGANPGVIYVPSTLAGNATSNCALSAQHQVFFYPGSFTCAGCSVTVANGTKLLGSGIGSTFLIQGTAGTNLIIGSSESDVEISGITFQGQAGTVTGTLNSAIFLSNAAAGNISRVNIHDNAFTSWRANAVFLQNVADSEVHHNFFYSNASSCVRGSGIVKSQIHNNICRDPSTTTFNIGIMLDSTAAANGTFPISTDVTIANNTVIGLVDWYGIEVHSGQRINITGNQENNVEDGVVVVPFNNSDTISDLVISSNSLVGQATQDTNCGGSSNYGISVQGGAVVTPANVTIVGNELFNFNAALRSNTQAGIAVGGSSNVVVTGNLVKSTYGNGIVVTGSGLGAVNALITSNQISNILTAQSTLSYCGDGSQSVGIDINFAGVTGFADMNQIDTTNQSAIRSEVAGSTGFVIGALNKFTNNAAIFSGANTLTGLGYASLDLIKTSAPSGDGNMGKIWADSGASRLKMNNFNTGATTIAGFSDNLGVFAIGGTIQPTQVNVGAGTGSTMTQVAVASTTGCATAAAAGATCTSTVTWPGAGFADTSYKVDCVGVAITSGVPVSGGITAKSSSQTTFQTAAGTAAAAQYTNIECKAWHP